jgi:hypothetical protein
MLYGEENIMHIFMKRQLQSEYTEALIMSEHHVIVIEK